MHGIAGEEERQAVCIGGKRELGKTNIRCLPIKVVLEEETRSPSAMLSDCFLSESLSRDGLGSLGIESKLSLIRGLSSKISL